MLIEEFMSLDETERTRLLGALEPSERRRLAELLTIYREAKRLQFTWHPRQAECNEAIERKRAEIAERTGGIGGVPIVLFGGGMGGGKSFYACAKSVETCERVPGFRVYMCRNEAKAFTRTTLDTMLRKVKVLQRPGWKHFKHDMVLRHENGSRIEYGGLGSATDAERVKSMEIDAAVIEEASEVEEEAARLLMTRPGRTQASLLHGYVLLTSNPEDCWLQKIVDDPSPDEVFVQSLLKDNIYLPDGYRERMAELYADMPGLLDAYIDGIWGVIGGVDKLIDASMLKNCIDGPGTDGDLVWGVDVARFGDDLTVLYRVRGTRVVGMKTWTRRSTREVADDIATEYQASETPPSRIIIDDIGVGGGVVDNLASAGLPVIGVNVGAAPLSSRFFNRRAEIYWNLRTLVERGELSIPNDDELISQLRAVRYMVKNGKIYLEAKADVKRRLGKSPDKADALALALAPIKAPRRIAGPISKPRGW